MLPPARRRLAAAGPTLAAAAAALAMLAAGPKAAPRREEGSRRPDRLGNAVREATTRAGPRAAERPRAAAPPRPARAPPPTRARALRAVEIFDLFVSFYPSRPRPPRSTLHASRPFTHTQTHTRHTDIHAHTHKHRHTRQHTAPSPRAVLRFQFSERVPCVSLLLPCSVPLPDASAEEAWKLVCSAPRVQVCMLVHQPLNTRTRTRRGRRRRLAFYHVIPWMHQVPPSRMRAGFGRLRHGQAAASPPTASRTVRCALARCALVRCSRGRARRRARPLER